MDEKKEPSNGQEEFSFLQEKIKEEPVDGKKVAGKLGRIAVYGVVFGVMASVGFFALKPWAETRFQKNPDKITIPEDKEDKEDADAQEEEQKTETIEEVTVEGYEKLYDSLYGIVTEAEKSIVEVKAVRGNEAWVTETYDTAHSAAGLVIADNGQEILVLADAKVLADAEEISVILGDGSSYNGEIKVTDRTLGLAVVGIQKSDIKSSGYSYLKVASLGNSYSLRRGELLIALGKPFGYMGGIGYGSVSATRYDMEVPDGEYDLLLTNISGSEKGSGILVNTKGEVMGIIRSGLTEGESKNMVNAIGISALKQCINLMANGEKVPYVGVLGTEVTEEISKEQGVPRGVYVREVVADSPAMEAGLLNGDIITKVGKEKIMTIAAYQGAVSDCKVNEKVQIEVMRRGKNGYVEMTFTVTAGSR